MKWLFKDQSKVEVMSDLKKKPKFEVLVLIFILFVPFVGTFRLPLGLVGPFGALWGILGNLGHSARLSGKLGYSVFEIFSKVKPN